MAKKCCCYANYMTNKVIYSWFDEIVTNETFIYIKYFMLGYIKKNIFLAIFHD